MKLTFIFWSNSAIVYCFLIIITNGVKIHYIENNSVPEYDPVNKTGCVIHDLHHVMNYSTAYIGMSFVIILLLMCMQAIPEDAACSFDDAACGGMPVGLAVGAYIGMFIACTFEFQMGELEYDDSTEFKKISEFITTGCDEKVMNAIYSGLLITSLPMLLLGAVIGCFMVGGILYGIVYVVWNRLKSCCDCDNINCKTTRNRDTNYMWQYECPVVIPPENTIKNNEYAISDINYHTKTTMKRSISYTSISTAPSYISLLPAYSDIATNITTETQQPTNCNLEIAVDSLP